MSSFFGFDLDRTALRAFVAEYYCHDDPDALSRPTENLDAQVVPQNGLQSMVDVHGPFMDAYRLIARIPGMPEVRESVWARALQTWLSM
ncbi:hypothetical protein PENSUB_1419 [Penicillium subrubescens]|uniref:Uncharacterized protein n=1 Tax=Penicillium subrubescens TaxID=1316194 RepID=A0A1Q5URW1_9EURO|nr:hypothetical protein PENSUB_1419 [Penicillium subrubescens]